MANILPVIKKIQLFLLVILAAVLTASCDNGGDCNINNVAYNRIHFYTIDQESGKENKIVYPGTLNVELIVNGKDSIVLNHVTEVGDIAVPLSYTNECDTLLLKYEDGSNDTLFVEHTNIPYFISMDCGIGMYHNLTDVRHTDVLLDSASIIHPFINFDAHENIKLYFIE